MSAKSREARRRLVWLAGFHGRALPRCWVYSFAAWWSPAVEDDRKTAVIRVPRSLRKYIGSTLRVLA